MPIPLEEQAALDFVLTLRRRWADTLYPHVAEAFEAAGEERRNDPHAVADVAHALPAYAWFGWMERGAQKMLWRASQDAVAADGTPDAPAADRPPFDLPAWYTDWDIHLQPGGVWSDAKAARVYELGAKLVMLGENDDYLFHRLFVDTAVPRRDYGRIVDLGCGFGKSTWPFKAAFPDAEVIGVDLAAPCLDLAGQRAAEKGLEVRFQQADALDTGLPSASADLVTSTMFLHEIPIERMERVFEEAARLLRPGGLVRFLDFQFTGDPLRDLTIVEHGERNNEPFMPPMMSADLIAMAEAAGLKNPRWRAFDERGAGLLQTLSWPKRREWHFPWAVLEAEKAA
jgi:ubiquinone/menaquinone biosynthesis C-methylase UbiE